MKLFQFLILCCMVLFAFGCGRSADADEQSTETVETITPVTITHVVTHSMADSVVLNATSSFQLKTAIKATANGYLTAVHAQLGAYLRKGQEVFIIKTKESEALGNTINVLDSSFRFTGVVSIRSPGSGYVTTLNYMKGNYVQDGEQLAVISDRNSFVFLLELPYELKPWLNNNKQIFLRLPDGTPLKGSVASVLPNVDSGSQTQTIVIRVDSPLPIPEGLIAKAIFLKSSRNNVMTLPKEAVLTDETQKEFWVMQLMDSSTAVKVPVTRGLTSGNYIEIVSPAFTSTDQFLLTGNYGLSDTAKVKVIR